MKTSLSPYGTRSVSPSPVNRMMTAFSATFREGIDINLGVGYVNQETMPRAEIAEALAHVLDNPATYRNALNYGSAQGSPNLMRAIKGFYRDGGFGRIDGSVLERSEMLIGASGATSILMGLAQVMKPGIVVSADPMYYIYCDYLERAGFEVLAIAEDAEGLRVDILREKLARLGERRKEVRFIFASTVGNPSSVVVSNARRRALVEIARELSAEAGTGVPVVFDAAYEALIHDPGVPRAECALNYDSDGLVYEVGSFSKILAPALRVGYLLGPRTELFEALLQNVSDMGFSAPLVIQEMAAFLIERDGLRQVALVKQEYARRAALIRGWIDTHLAEHIERVEGGQAGFYFYCTFRDTDTTERSRFFRYLTRTTGERAVDGAAQEEYARVVYIPGDYCVHPKGDLRETGKRQLRISYGYESMQRIEDGIRYMSEAARYASQG